MTRRYDAVVVGGGMVGAALALGLAKMHKQVALIERHWPAEPDAGELPGLRVSSLSEGSIALLQQLGAWDAIKVQGVKDYGRLSVWEKSHCRTDFDASSLGKSRLGVMAENHKIQRGLLAELKRLANVTLIAEGAGKLSLAGVCPCLELENGESVRADWLFAADGVNSRIRQQAGIATQGWQYNQQVLAMTVKTAAASPGHTWQQFYPSGPVAYLPLPGHYASLIWYDSASHIRELKAMDKAALSAAVAAHFPELLGEFTLLKHGAFPIQRQHAHTYLKGNVVLVGDAAHSVNPLAGQGVNLGYQDVACILSEINVHGLCDTAMTAYARARRRDNGLMMNALDGIYALFSNDLAPLTMVRNLMLTLAQRSGPLKRRVMAYAMGLE